MTPLFVGAGEIRKTNSWVFVVCCWFWFSLRFFKTFFFLLLLIAKILDGFKGTELWLLS